MALRFSGQSGFTSRVGVGSDFRKANPHPKVCFYPYDPHPACGHLLPLPRAKDDDPLPSDGRGDSDWMILDICERVVRYPGHGGLETGGSISRCALSPADNNFSVAGLPGSVNHLGPRRWIG